MHKTKHKMLELLFLIFLIIH